MRAGEEQAFREYTTARMPALLRTAYLLCGDWHHSEDIVSTAIVKLYTSWRRARRSEYPDAYVRRMVVNVWLDEQRRPWRRERSTATMPETAGSAVGVAGGRTADDDAIGTAAARRTDLHRLLEQLPSRQRAVLVLRFYDDLSVGQTAEILGCTEGAVKTLTSRALTSVRRLLPAGVTHPDRTGGRPMSTELRDLFNELVSDQPDHGIDLDERIQRGRRQSRVRNAATATLATVVTAGVIGAGFAFRPAPATDGSTGIAGRSDTPLVCSYGPHAKTDPRCPEDGGMEDRHFRSTQLSRLLAAQLDRLVPEHAGVRGFTRFDDQRIGTDNRPMPILSAGYLVDLPELRKGLTAFTLQVATRGSHVDQPFCMVMYLPKPQCTGQPRQLPDGSRATVHSQVVAGKTRYAVRVDRKDGTEILIESGITLNDDARTSVDVPVIGPERLLDIAQHITVKP